MPKTKLPQEEGEVWSEPAEKIKLRKVKHEINARVTISRRDKVRAYKKSY